MRLRSALQRRLVAAWQWRGPLAVLLWPLALLHAAVRWLLRQGARSPAPLARPVVVIGNLYVGGTGKTPLTIAIVQALRARGWRPGVISRGYGGQAERVQLISAGSLATEVGDEPLLIARLTAAPTAVGRDRVAAARLLYDLHPEVDLLIADDGLQHRALPREVELAVIHERGLGNGWLLPAGPLRDPPARLATVDAVVFNVAATAPRPVVRVHSPFFALRCEPGPLYALTDPSRTIDLAGLTAEQAKGRLRVLAVCGIGLPERFFAMLEDAGLRIDRLALHDHYPFADHPCADSGHDLVLVTEKDAVKCVENPRIAADKRFCVVPLRASVDPALIDFIEARLAPRRPAAAPPAMASVSATSSASPPGPSSTVPAEVPDGSPPA